MRTDLLRLLAATTLVLGSWGCDTGESDEPAIGAQSDDVVEGHIAHGHTEAVHINLFDQYGAAGVCSGALVAPTVVLTAGHCVDGFTRWAVTAPFADRQRTWSERGETYDWDVGMEFSFAKHDVGVLILDEPIVIDAYPTIATEVVEHGTEAVVIGRTIGGRVSDDWLFESEPVALMRNWAGKAYARYYIVPQQMIQQGDSGGPVYAYDPDADPENPGPRTIIGIASATHYVFRAHKTRAWVQTFIDDAAPN